MLEHRAAIMRMDRLLNMCADIFIGSKYEIMARVKLSVDACVLCFKREQVVEMCYAEGMFSSL